MLPYRKILVTGATGFLGGRLAEWLVQQGVEVVATGRNWHTGNAISGGSVDMVSADLTDPSQANLLVKGCDAVVHAAALSSPWGREEDFVKANILATRYLLDAAAEAGVKRFVFISTPSIYFNYKNRLNIREDDALPNPMVNAYARTKYEAEKLVLSSPLPTIALRPRAIIGRGDRVIMPRLLKAYHAGRLKRIGNGHNVADLTPVRNVVHAVACALQAPDDALGQAYNISAGGPVNLWQAIDDVLDQLGLEPVKGRVPVALAMAAATIMEWIGKISGKEPVLTRYSIGILTQSMSLNIDKAREKLGYEPLQSTQEALKEFADWWLTLAEEEKLNL